MTNKELNQLYWLNREIELDKQWIKKMDAEVLKKKRGERGLLPSLAEVKDIEEVEKEIEICKKMIELKVEKCFIEYKRLLVFIETVDDSYMRMILTLRHVNGLNWRQIAFHIGGGNTEDGVKMAHHRYLKKSQTNKE